MGGIAYGIGDWWRRLQENSALEQPDDIIGDITNPIRNFGAGVRDSFNAGAAGQEDPAIAGQKLALRNISGLGDAMFGLEAERPTLPPVMPPPGPTPLAQPEPQSSAPDQNAMAAALTRGLARRDALHAPSRFSNLEGADLRSALGYSDDTAKVAARAAAGPVETRSAFGQDYVPVSGGGGVSTFENEDSVREASLRDMESSHIASKTLDPQGLIADSARAQAEQRAKVGGQLAVESGKASIQDAQQQRRRDTYTAAITEAEQQYGSVRDAIESSSLPPEEKERRQAEAATRYASENQRINNAFGVGLGMPGLIAKPDVF